jgi:methyl-accepting chemotaxis protein
MGQTMTTVKGAVGEMESAVSEMQSSSQEIAKIIKTIDEIAFQTNLLALNAAVEAARAGEAGAGFAVVADEVRSLAQRSAQAAKDTSEKIEAAVKRSALGGVASKKVVSSLSEIEGSARNIEQVFNGIVNQIKSLDEIVGEISAASKEQSQGIAEVNSAVGQMDRVTQSNAAAAEENASAAEELNAQVGSLQEITSQLQTMVSGTVEAVASAPSVPRKAAAVRKAPKAFKRSTVPAVSATPGFSRVPQSSEIPFPESTGSAAGSFKDF